MDRVGLNQ